MDCRDRRTATDPVNRTGEGQPIAAGAAGCTGQPGGPQPRLQQPGVAATRRSANGSRARICSRDRACAGCAQPGSQPRPASAAAAAGQRHQGNNAGKARTAVAQSDRRGDFAAAAGRHGSVPTPRHCHRIRNVPGASRMMVEPCSNQPSSSPLLHVRHRRETEAVPASGR